MPLCSPTTAAADRPPAPQTVLTEAEQLRDELAVARATIEESDRLRRHGLLMQAFMDGSDLLAWLKDERGRLVWANRRWFEQLGIDAGTALDKTDFELFPEAAAQRMRARDLEVLGGHAPLHAIETTVDEHGREHCWRITRFPFHDAAGQRYVGSLADDDTERVRQHEYAHRQLITDNLTGLLNSHGFEAQAAPELLRARRRNSSCTLVCIGLNGLTGVNERLGHAAGDAIVSLASMILRKSFRGTDIVARVSDDRFAILAPDSSGEVDAIHHRLRAAVAALSANAILEAQFDFRIGLLHCQPTRSESLTQLLELVDRQMSVAA
ncbi:MAG: diguanylate cyclase [Nevskia sp.]|nr:diguanylate cyclase [Nevskia sp.]